MSFSVGSYSSTAAPAPSASSTAMLRSFQSTQRERCSAPMTRTRLLPVSRRPWAVRTAYMKPLQAAFTSMAGQRQSQLVRDHRCGRGRDAVGGVVASTKKSMSLGSMPASSMARLPATAPRRDGATDATLADAGALVNPLVGGRRVSESSSLVTIRSGTAMPQPIKRTPMSAPSPARGGASLRERLDGPRVSR